MNNSANINSSAAIAVFLVLFLFAVAFFVYITSTQRKKKKVDEERYFNHSGISIDYYSRKIRWKDYEYSLDDVARISYDTYIGKSGGVVTIEVNDVRKPIHKLKFITQNKAETCYAHLRMGLEKGGRNFS